MPIPIFNFKSILRTFICHEIDFIVVGGVCAVLHGAPITTFDLDLVHSRDQTNLDKVVKALAELEAYYRDLANRRLKPQLRVLSGPGQNLFMTNGGALDLLGSLGEGQDYQALIAHTDLVKLDEEMSVRLLDLETLIEIKNQAGRDKDLIVLPILKRTLERKRERDKEPT